MSRIWMLCPADSHTCIDKKCFTDGCRGVALRSATTAKLVEPSEPAPLKDDPMTWEVKEQ